MQNSVGMRVKQARKHAKLTQVELAKAVNTSQGAISDLENGRNESSTNLVQMAKVMGVSATWLATGEGSMIETSTQLQTQNGQMQIQGGQKQPFDLQAYIDSLPNGITHEQALAEGRESIFVDVYDISYCCGDGNPDIEYEALKKKLPFDPSFFIKRGVTPENFKMIYAKGDSMAKYINEGDAIGVDISQRELKDGEVYALFLDGDNMIKRIFLEGGGRLRLSSDNPMYKDKIIDPEFADSLYIVGKVIYRSG